MKVYWRIWTHKSGDYRLGYPFWEPHIIEKIEGLAISVPQIIVVGILLGLAAWGISNL